MKTFALRILKSTWGIVIDLTAEAVVGEPPDDSIPVGGRFALSLGSPPVTLPDDEVAFLVSGLRRVAPQIEDAVQGEEPITVVIRSMRFAPADFQPEGLEPAIIGWAADEFDFEPPVPEVTFDKNANRYVFTYDDAPSR